MLLAGEFHWPQGAEIQVNAHTTGQQVRPALAMDADGNFAVAWEGDGANGRGIYVRQFNAAGAALGDEFRVDSPTAVNRFAPTIAMEAGGDFVVAWLSLDEFGASHLPIYARRYSAAGAPLGNQFRVDQADADQQQPRVAVDADGDFVIVWLRLAQSWRVYGRRYDATGAPQGEQFQVNTYTTNGQSRPTVAMDPTGNFVVTWESYNQDGAGTGIYAQRYNAAGAAQGGEFRVNTYTTDWQEYPSVAMDADGDFVITWQSDYQDGHREGVYAQRFNAAGVQQGTEFRVNTHTSFTQSQPSVAMDAEGSFVVAWFSDHKSTTVTSTPGIYAQRYSNTGVPQGSEFRVNSFAAPALQSTTAMSSAGNFVVLWSGPVTELIAQRYATFDLSEAALVGDRVWNDANSNGIQEAGEAGIAGATVELYRADGLPVTATTTDATGLYQFGVFPGASAYLRFVTPLGFIPTRQNAGGDNTLDSDADRVTGQVALIGGAAGSIDNGVDAGFVAPASVSGIVFYDRNGDGVRNGGDEGMSSFVVFLDENGNGTFDTGEAMDSSDFAGSYTIGNVLGGPYSLAVTGQDLWNVPPPAPLVVPSGVALTQISIPVRTSVPDAAAIAVGEPIPISTITHWPRVASDADGDFVVVFEGQKGAHGGVYARRYNAAGQPQGDQFLVNTYTTGVQRSPDVAMDSAGNFVITWMSLGQDGWGYGVYAQRYSAAGLRQGTEFRVNATTVGDQWSPSIAMDGDGDFVIAWEASGIGGEGDDVHAQRFDASGVPQGPELRANTYTTLPQRSTDVAMNAEGRFVITWMSFGQDDSLEGIYAQRYDAAGNTLGGEFQVHNFTTGAQLFPSVAMDADGDFVIAWESYSNYGVHARRYNASGVPQGSEFPVNPPTVNGSRAAIAMDADGDCVITWRSYDGAGNGIFAQRFNAAGVPQGGQFLVNPDPADNQWSATVAMDADGDFVVAWHQYDTVYSTPEMFAQRYAVAQRPTVTSSQFAWQSAPQRIEYAFDEDVSASLGSDDIVIENLTTGTTIPSSDIVSNWNPVTNTARFTFPTLPNGGSLPDGDYRATLLSNGVFNQAGTTLAADWAVEFFFLAGDANHDGRVNLQDFNRLATNFGQSPRDFTQGDFNYDGVVNLIDFNILAGRFGRELAPQSLPARTVARVAEEIELFSKDDPP